jgi:hypothetical protein
MKNTETKRLKKFARIYAISSGFLTIAVIGYLILISFPQMLFAHRMTHGRFVVYSNDILDDNVVHILDQAESRLLRSPLNDESVKRRVFLTGSSRTYALLSHKAYNSFGNSVPFIDNIFINRSDPASDKVFINRAAHNSRSLSGVIAHEVTHLFIRRKYGELSAISIPNWKIEGYCEYVAGSSTLTFNEGMALWRSDPDEDLSYRYFKYHMMVKYLIENEGLSVEELFSKRLDEKDVTAKALTWLSPGE